MVYCPARQNSTNRDPLGTDIAVGQDKKLVPIIGSLFSLSTNGINSIFECRGFFIVLIGDVCKYFQIFSWDRMVYYHKLCLINFFPQQFKKKTPMILWKFWIYIPIPMVFDFQSRCLVILIISISFKDKIGFSNHSLWHCFELGSKILASGPMGQAKDMTIFSRNGSMGGLVTYKKEFRNYIQFLKITTSILF